MGTQGEGPSPPLYYEDMGCMKLAKTEESLYVNFPPKILTDTIDDLNQDIAELRGLNAQLRDALRSILREPYDKSSQAYARMVLLKSDKEIGRKYYHE